MDLKKIKQIVAASYDTQVSLYKEESLMQLGNLENLFKYLFKSGIIPSEAKYLDLGCGIGIPSEMIQKKFKGKKVGYYGVDISFEMIGFGKRAEPAMNLVVGDIEDLSFKNASFDVVISNSVLHWLNVPEIGHTPYQVLTEVYRVLKNAGILGISVSGYGTAEQFQESYRKIIGKLQKELDFKAELYRKDPIGSMYLEDLVNILTRVGFTIKREQMDYEPVKYKHPAHYVKAVKAYGYEMYLASIPEEAKEEAWRMIENDFIKKVGHSEYEHDQYMIYVIASKEEP